MNTLSKLLEEYEKSYGREVFAAFVWGSQLTGLNDANSDLDCIFYVFPRKEEV